MVTHHHGWSKYIVGWGLVALGVLLMLDKLGIITGSLWSFWPVIVILVGIGVLARSK